MTIENFLSIGITTKNRWNDLENTLERIFKIGLSEVPVYVFDDGSDNPCPFDISGTYPNVSFKRFEESEGLITRRNQLAEEIKTKYYLSLDDDSYIVSGSLKDAVEFLESRKDMLCLSLPIYNPVIEQPQSESLRNEPYQVRSFIGCGHILHRNNFLKLGGYSEELIHQGEEKEIAARGFQQGLYCYHFPGLEIHHTASNAGRNWDRMDYYGARNNILWNDWFVPPSFKLIKQVRTLTSQTMLAYKVRRMGQMRGELAGLIDVQKYKLKRQPMTIDVYRSWCNLPIS